MNKHHGLPKKSIFFVCIEKKIFTNSIHVRSFRNVFIQNDHTHEANWFNDGERIMDQSKIATNTNQTC